MKKGLVLLAAGTIALLAAGFPTIASAERPTAAGTVMAVTGHVTVWRLAAAPQLLKAGDTLYWRDVVQSRKDSVARILLGGKTTLTVRELSRLELRQEARADGIRYTVELISGKVRASVARVLMRPGEEVEVRTRNAVASVRGTDFIVEAAERPGQARAFGLLTVLGVGESLWAGGRGADETVVATLSGVVEVTNRLVGPGRVERLGEYEAARVGAKGGPVRLQVHGEDLKLLLQGLTSPPLQKKIASQAVTIKNK